MSRARRSPPGGRPPAPPAARPTRVTPGLYPRLLGPAWPALDPLVRRAHADGDTLIGIGTFVVRHGVGWLVRLLVRCDAVPAASDACPVRVTIRRHGREERWHRQLAAMRLVTVQRSLAGGLLAERLGPLEFRFRLSVVGGALVYRQVGLALCLGPFRPRVPRRLAPWVEARERPDLDGISTNVAVAVTAPGGALLFSYQGRVRWAVGPAGGSR